MSLVRYAIVSLGVVAVTLGLSWPLLLRPLDPGARRAVALGTGTALLNTVAAHAFLRWSDGRSTSAFLRALLGGMIVRMAFMLAAVLVGFLLLDLPRVPLAVSLLSYFVLFLAMELGVVHQRSGALAGATR